MSELIPFSSIDPYSNDFFYENNEPKPEEEWPYPPETVEAAEFLSKMDWEGGIDGLYGYGGAEVFPEPIRHLAEAYGEAFEALRKGIDDWAAERGVEY